MESSPPPSLSRRVLIVLFAVALGIALVGFLVGTRPAITQEAGSRAREPAGVGKAPAARTYSQLRRDRAFPGRPGELAGVIGEVPTAVPKRAPTAAQKTAALLERRKRRAYDGAPPVIPHGVQQRSSAACLTCHRKGAVVNGKTAPPISHPEMTSCTQCHVSSQQQPPGPADRRPVANSFNGVVRSGRGPRAGIGSPPVIPHRTWMRNHCLACHGPAGKPGLRTTHPQRTSCRQCHASSSNRHPPGPPR